jgi:hypothetical protein
MVKQILIELDEETAAKLEVAAPARSRRRSAFIREAIWRALWELEEKRTREAYLRAPDAPEPAWPEPPWEAWSTKEPKPRARKR